MKLKLIFALCALSMSLVSFGRDKFHVPVPSGPKNEIIAGELLIKLKPVKGNPRPAPNVKRLPAGSSFRSYVGPTGWTLWFIPKEMDPRVAASMAKADPAVAY